MSEITSDRLHPWLFFALVFSLSWGFWTLAAILSTKGAALPTRVLHCAGGLVPIAVTVALTYLRQTPDFQQDFWRRAVDFKPHLGGGVDLVALAVVLRTGKLPVRPGAGHDALLTVHDGPGSAIRFDDVGLQQQWAEHVVRTIASLHGQPDGRAIWTDTPSRGRLHSAVDHRSDGSYGLVGA